MPKQPPETVFQFQFPLESIDFDPEAFDNLIKNHGVEMVHWYSMGCPIGLGDRDDIRQTHDHHENCSNGFIYKIGGTVTCSFLSNTNDIKFLNNGMIDSSMVQVSIPRFYDNSDNRVEVSNFDRFYLSEKSITVIHWEKVSHSLTGVDKLQFPAVSVTDIVDAHGKTYGPSDYSISNGKIVWGAKRPGIDAKTKEGVIYTIRYRYRPFWYVKTIPHEVRVAQLSDPETGQRSATQLAQMAIFQREYQFESEQADSQTSASARKPEVP